MKLKDLVTKQQLIMRMYAQVTDFQRMLEIEEKVIEPMERIMKTYEKNRKGLIELAKENESEANKKHLELLEEEVKLKLIKVNKDEIKEAGFNVFEYRQIKEYLK